MVIVGIIVGLLVLVLLVVLHELGHALMAKRHGVIVEEFGIGFPPAAKKWRPKQSILGKNVVISLNWLPLGGFVRLRGEHDSATGRGTYGAASVWAKTQILLAGVVMNWLTAAALFTVLAVVGLPKLLPQQVMLPFDSRIERSPLTVGAVTKGSPAEQAGLQTGDKVLRIGDIEVATPSELSAATKVQAGQSVAVVVVRGSTPMTKHVTLQTPEQAKNGGYLGISPHQSEKIYATWSAPLAGILTTGQLTYETLKGVGATLADLVTGLTGRLFGSVEQQQVAQQQLAAVGDSVAGPVGILGVLFPAVVSAGIWSVVLMAALISLTLAVMNILPIPALDGGRWVTMILFRMFGRTLTKEREEAIQATGMLMLLLLTIMVTWSDVAKLF